MAAVIGATTWLSLWQFAFICHDPFDFSVSRRGSQNRRGKRLQVFGGGTDLCNSFKDAGCHLIYYCNWANCVEVLGATTLSFFPKQFTGQRTNVRALLAAKYIYSNYTLGNRGNNYVMVPGSGTHLQERNLEWNSIDHLPTHHPHFNWRVSVSDHVLVSPPFPYPNGHLKVWVFPFSSVHTYPNKQP